MESKLATIIGKRLLFIIAHPDDESFLACGTIRKNFESGGQSFILCATLGEKGTSHLKKKLSATELKKVRKAELSAAAKYLGVTKLHTFQFPDTELLAHKQRLYTELLPISKKCNPDFIISFGADGITGHLDHISIGEVANKISRKLKKPFLNFAISPKLYKSAKRWLGQKRKEGKYVNDFEYKQPHIKIPIDGKVKLKAFGLHKSQMDGNKPFSGIPKTAVSELLKAEYYVDHSRI